MSYMIRLRRINYIKSVSILSIPEVINTPAIYDNARSNPVPIIILGDIEKNNIRKIEAPANTFARSNNNLICCEGFFLIRRTDITPKPKNIISSITEI